MNSLLEVDGVNLAFSSEGKVLQVLREVNIRVCAAERVAILGRSGLGKSTLLKAMAGLVAPDTGKIHWRIPRAIGDCVLLPQSPAVIEHLTVEDQIRLPRRLLGRTRYQLNAKSVELLTGFGLSERDQRKVKVASAGQKQAIALVGMLSLDPTLVLLDEPFASVDALSRQAAMQLLGGWLRRHERSAVLVTHSIWEALDFADRILVFTGVPLSIHTEYVIPQVRSSAENASFHDQILHTLRSAHAH